jgi:hypothetical protein
MVSRILNRHLRFVLVEIAGLSQYNEVIDIARYLRHVFRPNFEFRKYYFVEWYRLGAYRGAIDQKGK